MSTSSSLIFVLYRTGAALVQGIFDLIRNSAALIGLSTTFVVIALYTHPELQQQSEAKLLDWLQQRRFAATEMVPEPQASQRATASDPEQLPRQQAMIAFWLSKKYRVAPEPISAIVAQAFELGQRLKLNPKLILAVMAIESGFNPFAQSSAGAQGLMQVMTRVHSDKYQHFGGTFAAFDPAANLQVGSKILLDGIRSAGSVEGGLKIYVGASNLADDNGYSDKVLAEYQRLEKVALGQRVPIFNPSVLASKKAAAAPATTPQPPAEAPAETPDEQPVADKSNSTTLALN